MAFVSAVNAVLLHHSTKYTGTDCSVFSIGRASNALFTKDSRHGNFTPTGTYEVSGQLCGKA